jgi:hypothetical protein
MRGTSRPEPHLRDAIEVLTGVAGAAWELESERVAKQAAIERIHDAEVLASEASSEETDSEPTNPAVPVAKRQSSAPPPAVSELVDATAVDDETTARTEQPPAGSTPRSVQPVKVSERERLDTDPDPRAGEELLPTPKPLTVLDRERISTPPEGAR